VVLAAFSITNAGDEDEDRKPTPQPEYGLVSAVFSYPRRGNLERAANTCASLNKIPAKQLTFDHVKQLYRDVHFETVREMAERGISWENRTYKLGHEHSVRLAVLRDQMINKTYEQMALSYALEFVRLDFGNKMSGVKSDVDHTGYTVWDQFKGLNIRAEFEKRFKKLWGITQERCDIVIHSGRNSVPDWRTRQSVVDFDATMLRVLKGLSGTPDAYDMEGSWRLQVEQRSAKAVENLLKNLKAIESELKQKGLSPQRRAELEKLKKQAEGKNPCTSFKPGKDGKIDVSKSASILSKLFMGVNVDVLRMYAFDVCVGNFLFHMHHEDKTECTKYVLRSFEEGVTLLRALAKGQVLKPLEYAKLTDSQRKIQILDLYPKKLGYTARQRDQIKRILDIAMRLRANHKAPPDRQIPPEKVWHEMMEYLKARSRRTNLPREELMRMAKLEYNRASTEVLVWNNQRTSQVRYKAWLEPRTLARTDIQLLGQIVPGATTERLQLSAFYALKKAFAVLPPEQVERIIQSASERNRRDLRILRDVVRTEKAQSGGRVSIDPQAKPLGERLTEALESVKQSWAQRYSDFWYAVRNDYYSDDAITERLWGRIYEQLGYEYKLVYDGFKADAPRWVREWNAFKALGNLVNAGNALSALNVLRVYQQGGSKEEVIAAILWEGLYRVPGVAHILAMRDGLYYGRWHGVKFLLASSVLNHVQQYAIKEGIGWAMPVGGGALLYLTLAKMAVETVGYEIFDPLTGDDADLMYVGRTGPTPPPEEFTDVDGLYLERLERKLEGKRRAAGLTDDLTEKQREKVWSALPADVREELTQRMKEVGKLQKKKGRWKDYERRKARWEKGLIRPGLKEPVVAQSFEPILGKQIPLKFFVGEFAEDEEEPVDLTAKPLDARERDQLDTLMRKVAGLRQESQGFELPDRVERLCYLMEQVEELAQRDHEAARAQRCQAFLAASPEWMIEARRQNLSYYLEPQVQKVMRQKGIDPKPDWTQMTEADSQKHFGARKEIATQVIRDHVRHWYDTEYTQLRSIGLHQEALARLIGTKDRPGRMQSDYFRSEKLAEQFEDYLESQRDARRKRREQRRAFLLGMVAQSGMSKFLEKKGREHCADYGLMVLTRNSPKAKPVVRLAGVVDREGGKEGEERKIKFRVKVLASPVDYPPPYKVTLKAKGGGEGPKGVKKRILVAVVHDKDGKLVGSTDVPVNLEKFTEKEEVAETREWPLPPKLLGGGRRDLQHWPTGEFQLHVGSILAGGPVGDYRMTVQVASKTYTVWGKIDRPGSATQFLGIVPLPPGKTEVTFRVPGVPPLTETYERPQSYTGHRFSAAKFAEAKEHMAKARADMAKGDADARQAAARRFCNGAAGVAWGLHLQGNYKGAIAQLQEGLDVLPTFGADDAEDLNLRLHLYWYQAQLGFLAGDPGLLVAATRQRAKLLQAKADREDDAKQKESILGQIDRAYDNAFLRCLPLSGSASSTLWRERMAHAQARHGPDPIPPRHPHWGPGG
jgi:hypothetical protein